MLSIACRTISSRLPGYRKNLRIIMIDWWFSRHGRNRLACEVQLKNRASTEKLGGMLHGVHYSVDSSRSNIGSAEGGQTLTAQFKAVTLFLFG